MEKSIGVSIGYVKATYSTSTGEENTSREKEYNFRRKFNLALHSNMFRPQVSEGDGGRPRMKVVSGFFAIFHSSCVFLYFAPREHDDVCPLFA